VRESGDGLVKCVRPGGFKKMTRGHGGGGREGE